MMRMAKEAIGPDKILLLNNAAHIPELFEIGDAFMFEHYQDDLLSKEAFASDWALMKKVHDAGKISVWRIGVEVDPAAADRREGGRPLTPEFLENLSREKINYYLAAFLVGAQEYSYFQYGWGWRLDTGPLCNYPELKALIGKPLSACLRVHPDKWEFTRNFEHLSVWVDTETREARLNKELLA